MAKKCGACGHNHDPNTTCDICGHFWVSSRFPSFSSTSCYKYIPFCFGADEIIDTAQMITDSTERLHDESTLHQLHLRSLLTTARMVFRNVFASEMGLQSEFEAMNLEDENLGESIFDLGSYLGPAASAATRSGAQLSSGQMSSSEGLRSFGSQRYVILSIGNSTVGCARWRIVNSYILGDTAQEALRGGGSAVNDGPSPDYVALIDRFTILGDYRQRGCGKQLISAVLSDVYKWAVKAAEVQKHDPLSYLPAVATLLPQVTEFDPALRLFANKARFVLLRDALPITPYCDPSRIFSRAIHVRRPTKDFQIESNHGTLDPISLAAAGGSTTYMQLAVLMLPPSLVIDTLRRE